MDQIIQKLSSVFMYTLPLKASMPFGYYFFKNYLFLKTLIDPLIVPIEIIEKTLPYGSFFLYILLIVGLVRNPKVPYFVRYNTCQALLINIALILITYLLGILPIFELGSIILIVVPIIFIFTLCIIIFSIFQCIYGIEPEIPLISKSVRMQIQR